MLLSSVMLYILLPQQICCFCSFIGLFDAFRILRMKKFSNYFKRYALTC